LVHGKLHKLLMRAGMIVDATIIAAPSSTKNQDESRDPEIRSDTHHPAIQQQRQLDLYRQFRIWRLTG